MTFLKSKLAGLLGFTLAYPLSVLLIDLYHRAPLTVGEQAVLCLIAVAGGALINTHIFLDGYRRHYGLKRWLLSPFGAAAI
ncbi:MAG: hypothetical protein GC134_07390 [Proteobacteria bacterium]|nr:hypothetical protein [Pseudomonadota bacterium]